MPYSPPILRTNDILDTKDGDSNDVLDSTFYGTGMSMRIRLQLSKMFDVYICKTDDEQ